MEYTPNMALGASIPEKIKLLVFPASLLYHLPETKRQIRNLALLGWKTEARFSRAEAGEICCWRKIVIADQKWKAARRARRRK